jgi:VanZ family protein
MDKACRWPLVVAGLIAYGSLYPFGFAMPVSLDAFWDELLAQRRLWTGFGDVAGNVLLFMPLGAAGVLCIGAHRLTVLRAAKLLAAGVAFALAVQVLQVFEPTRNPALSDVFWNALGTVVGIGTGAAVERYVSALPRPAWPRSRFAVALIAAWVAAELWPFVPSLDWSAIKQVLKPVVLAPSFGFASFAYHFASVLVLGMLLQASGPPADAARRLWLLVTFVLGGKLVFSGATLSLSFVAACLAGAALWRIVAARLGASATLVLLAAMLGSFTLRSLAPLELRAAPEPFGWIPFQALLEGSMSANVRSLLAQLFAFGAMLWLVERAGGRLPGAAAALAVWVGLIEVAQMWIVGRTPDITPSFLVIGIALVFDRLKRTEALSSDPGDPERRRHAGPAHAPPKRDDRFTCR